jgi:23S rRNA pseudouridine1911/1915/1917 synthase
MPPAEEELDPVQLADASADDSIVVEDVATPDEDSDVRHFKFRVSKKLTRRIDQYLVDRVPYLSRAGVQRLIDDGLVTVDGRKTKASYKLKAGETVSMVAPPEPVNEIVPEDIPLDIVYEDEHFLALNKQADLIIHPARGRWHGTLVNGLAFYGNKWSNVNGVWRPGILHRLDRNTTGIMLVAKSDEAHWRIARQFENRTIQKTYVAVCHGVPELLSDVIDMPIGKDRYVREKQAIRKEENGGKHAVTRYEIQEILDPTKVEVAPGPEGAVPSSARLLSPTESGRARLGSSSNPYTLLQGHHPHDRNFKAPPGRFTFVKLWPKTGRTHQLRVHMAAIGYPMLGDTMYGGRVYESGDFRFERQALHAFEITFVHPATLKTITLAAPVPPDMRQLLGSLGGTVPQNVSSPET